MGREQVADRRHDAEWLLQRERLILDGDLAKVRRTKRPPMSVAELSIGVAYEPDPREMAAARRVVEACGAPHGAGVVAELLAALGLEGA